LCLLLFGCNNTVGIIELKGKVIDENTKTAIPNMSVVVEAIDQQNDKPNTIYVGFFTTDSSGCFAYTFKKVKNRSFYNFSIKGNPEYDPSNQILGLTELNSYGKHLSFEVKRLADFTIRINRESTTAYRDTLIVSWETNGIDGKILYPFKIVNGTLWIGGDVKSEIKTKVFADKNTIVNWKLFRNGKRKDIIDTIYCSRDVANSVNLTY